MVNVPGAIYRSAWHAGYTLELISDEIERISGYPPDNFIASSKRTLMDIIHPDDREGILAAVQTAGYEEPFVLEYRILRADGSVRWVLDRGQLVPGRGRPPVDGRGDLRRDRPPRGRAGAPPARDREARTEELRASRQRIVEAADAARRRIERDLHDGAQQRLVSMALEVRLARARGPRDPDSAAPFLEHLGEELAQASSELRELARGIHPAVLTDRGLAAAISALASRAPVPVDVVELPRPARARDGGHGVLHRRRGADERRQVRRGHARHRARRPRGTASSWWRSATTASAVRTPTTARG